MHTPPAACATGGAYSATGQPARKPAAKPAPTQVAPTRVVAPVNGAEQADYWSVNSSTGSQYASGGGKPQQAAKTTVAPKPAAGEHTRSANPSENTPLDRVKLRDAPGSSIGFASGDSTRSGRFHDGRDVPGLTANTQYDSSYVGLSLSTSSGSKGLPFPLPGPVYGRPE
mgnify:CR=1 FL=1